MAKSTVEYSIILLIIKVVGGTPIEELGYRVWQPEDPGYQFQHLPAMGPLTGPQRPADNKTSRKNRTRN